MNNHDLALAWVNALNADVINWRFIHDQDKARPAIKRRGTLQQIWQEAAEWNAAGYGVFACVNEMDGVGDTGEHVSQIRAHVVDLDNLSAMENLQRAAAHQPAPWFAVQTSPGKAHVYWPLSYPANLEQYRTLQRKLRQFFDGDKAVIDATRVLRVPGFYHCKGERHLVTCYALPGYGVPISLDALNISLAHVNAIDSYGGRHPLGAADLAAPSAEWVRYALESMRVEGMTHPEFISFTAAWKQAAWNVLDANEARDIWLKWCEKFGTESKGLEYNLKHWDSITETEIGWKSLLRQNPNLNAAFLFQGATYQPPAQTVQTAHSAQPGPIPSNQSESAGPLLLADDCMQYFANCTFVTRFGAILDPKGQLLSPGQFNGVYGGPRFVINNTGAPSDEPWKAATRSIFWRIPTVDYLRFLPHEPPGKIIADELDRTGVNVFRPARIAKEAGDPSPFLHHLSLLLPDPNDRKGLLDFIAHNAQYPGHKIPWAPVVQSAEGAGKGVFKSLMRHLVGSAYFHSPNAKELTESGQKFNDWMRRKLFILVDEIRTDERRDMIEVLKPWISEKEIEIQGKGDNQEKEDNYSNWAFFTNYKDAVPINQNSRRFAMYYSAIQSAQDLQERQMGDSYFNWLHKWLEQENGLAILANYFINEYQIQRGSLPMRAPTTSSHSEAIRHGRTVNERAILDAIDAGLQGFRGGWVSSFAAVRHLRASSSRAPSDGGIERILEGLGFHNMGRAPRTHWQENQGQGMPVLFNTNRAANPADYFAAQGYE